MSPSPLYADISSNNSEFSAAPYREAGHLIVAIKATEGVAYANPEHRPWCYDAQIQRLAVIHYHFARPDLGNNPESEAAYFLELALPLAGARDYLMLDLERGTPQGWLHDPEWSCKFDQWIQGHSRFHTLLYASRSTLASADAWLIGPHKRVVDADWSTGPDYTPPGYHVFARQQSGVTSGIPPYKLPGVGACDVNALRGVFFDAVVDKFR